MYKRGAEAGFTLIELMIVIAIIGILAIIAVPNFQDLVCRSKQAEVPTILEGIRTAQQAYLAQHNVFGSGFAQIGYDVDGAREKTDVSFDTQRYHYDFVTSAEDIESTRSYTVQGYGQGEDVMYGDYWTLVDYAENASSLDQGIHHIGDCCGVGDMLFY